MTEVVRRTLRTSAAAGYRVFSTADPVHAHDYICDAYANTTMRMIGDQTSLRMRDEQHELGVGDVAATVRAEVAGVYGSHLAAFTNARTRS